MEYINEDRFMCSSVLIFHNSMVHFLQISISSTVKVSSTFPIDLQTIDFFNLFQRMNYLFFLAKSRQIIIILAIANAGNNEAFIPLQNKPFLLTTV